MEKSTHSKEYGVLCAKMREIREAAGLSQRELAARLDLPHSWIAKVECGERRLDIVEFYWLVSACEQQPGETFNKLISQFESLSRRQTNRGSRKR
jgi:transcriptional regulator with XRE-family HTH domain